MYVSLTRYMNEIKAVTYSVLILSLTVCFLVFYIVYTEVNSCQYTFEETLHSVLNGYEFDLVE